MTIKKDVVWVQTWEDVKGVQTTGVKIDMPMHRLFVINKEKENKINNDVF
jgi:hypothetical protein